MVSRGKGAGEVAPRIGEHGVHRVGIAHVGLPGQDAASLLTHEPGGLLEVVDRSVLPIIFGGDDDSLDLSRDQGPWMGRAPPPPLVRVVSASPETVSPASQADSARSPPTVPKPSPERARELIEKRRSVASPLSRAVA